MWFGVVAGQAEQPSGGRLGGGGDESQADYPDPPTNTTINHFH